MMDDLEDAALKQEIDTISRRIETIMEKVDAIYPSHPPEGSEKPSEPESHPAEGSDPPSPAG